MPDTTRYRVETVREPPLSVPTSQTRIALTFLLMLGLLNGACQVEKRLSGRILDMPYTRLVTGLSARVGERMLPIPVERRGDITLGSGNAEVMVRGGCNGIETLFLMAAGVLAYPAPWRRRVRALLIYLPVLFALNLLRVVMLLYVLAVHPAHLDTFHYQVGQGVLVVFVFGFWVRYVNRGPTLTPRPPLPQCRRGGGLHHCLVLGRGEAE